MKIITKTRWILSQDVYVVTKSDKTKFTFKKAFIFPYDVFLKLQLDFEYFTSGS